VNEYLRLLGTGFLIPSICSSLLSVGIPERGTVLSEGVFGVAGTGFWSSLPIAVLVYFLLAFLNVELFLVKESLEFSPNICSSLLYVGIPECGTVLSEGVFGVAGTGFCSSLPISVLVYFLLAFLNVKLLLVNESLGRFWSSLPVSGLVCFLLTFLNL